MQKTGEVSPAGRVGWLVGLLRRRFLGWLAFPVHGPDVQGNGQPERPPAWRTPGAVEIVLTMFLRLAILHRMNMKQDIKTLLAEVGWSPLNLAAAAGVSKDSIYRLLNGSRKGGNSTTLEKLYPFLYGDKRPAPKPEAAPSKEAA